ncbi:embryonic polarity protein dorsal-like isoform X5 [Leptidea sinapis]|uniref:embryonic polarity protein dorsal-like isoform X5 n=1 Tax=Leptidea sinapis TaxID=189913 RepID=UPI0021C41860|nr:embryonic polarity protein dorsal-like isoform X5 [Leptidea sinapis]
MDNGDAALPVGPAGEQPTNLNISDVIEAITRADPVYGADVEAMSRPCVPRVRIVEQPASKALRFRYECEGRSAGSIPGVNSTPERKTYPTIEISGHRGPAVIVVSCVTREEPFKPHPHNLVGRDRCDKGVCTVKTTLMDDNKVSFSNLGIQCVKRKDIAEALKTREQLKVDPFKTGYSHRNQPQSIDLNAVRLCFQVFLPDERTGKIRQALPPVVSDIIYDKKAMSDLLIMRISQCSASPRGGTEILLLCEKVVREDVAVVFFEKDGERVVWEENGNITLVHKQVAIAFYTPPYRDPHSQHHVQVYVQLKRTSDNARSNAIPFEFVPDYQDSGYLKHKRQKKFSTLIHQYEQDRGYADQQIKAEPRDKTPPHQMSSPLRVFSPAYSEQDLIHDNNYQQWNIPNVQVGGPGGPLVQQNYAQELQWGSGYVLSPGVHPGQSISPSEASMSPMGQVVSPMGRISPMAQHSPLGVMSPIDRISPLTPMHGAISPNLAQMNTMGHISPTHHNMHMQHQPQGQEMMETVSDTPSLTGLLMDRGEMLQMNSAELSGLSSLLDRAPDLSDSLNRLSTSDLLR